MNGVSCRLWEDRVVAYFRVLVQHLPAGTEENLKGKDHFGDTGIGGKVILNGS
jgi:hypothetical protein